MQSVKDKTEVCTSCPIHLECRQPIPFEGTLLAPVMIVGRNPTLYDDKANSMFAPSKENEGSYVNRLIEDIGLKRRKVFLTTALKCATSIPSKNRPPMTLEYEFCANRFLYREIEAVKPQLIIAFGVDVFHVVAKDFKAPFSMNVGRLVVTEDEWVVFPMYHPSSLQQPSLAEAAGQQIRTLQHIMNMRDKEIHDRTFREVVIKTKEAKKIQQRG